MFVTYFHTDNMVALSAATRDRWIDTINTILSIITLVAALGLVAAFTIAIPALGGHIALARMPSQRIQPIRVQMDRAVDISNPSYRQNEHALLSLFFSFVFL